MYVYVCDITTCTSSRYEHEQHTYHSGKDIKFYKFKNTIIPSGGTHAQSIGGSTPTSQHSALLDVADHSRCRTMFALQSLEHPQGSRRSEDEEEDVGSHQEEASSRGDAPQKPAWPHTRAGVAMRMAILEACPPNSLCTQRIRTGKLGSNSTEERWCWICCLVFAAEDEHAFLIDAKGGR